MVDRTLFYTNNTKGVGNLKSSAVSTSSDSGIALKTSIVAFEESNTYNFPKPIFIFAEKTFNSNNWWTSLVLGTRMKGKESLPFVGTNKR